MPNAASKTAITPRRDEDFPEWYQQVVRVAELAEPSDVRGCMVIRPWGYGVWENMQHQLDAMFRATGHRNAYFPLFIPLSYFAKEAEHVEGFAKECAVVTHTRLEVDADGKMKPASPLTEPLVVRPTSETIIGASYARWVQSYRDLPVLINQWANVVRWEMRPRLFLRTTEFLWQEGHTVHETEAEARAEAKLILDLYERFVRDHLAVPVFTGEKSESERFPGAVQTLAIEAMVQDRRAIQAGTSHFLGQNFARASGIQFQNREGKQEFGWTTSWGMTTRLIGTLIMMHGDDDGIVLPPRIAPTQIVILPVATKEESRTRVMNAGAHGAEFAEVLTEATVMDAKGKIRQVLRKQISFKYRSSNLGNVIVVEAKLALIEEPPAKLKELQARLLRWRKAGTPFDQPCAGSVFKNPGGPRTAGALIDECGLKGFTIGGAQVSPLHANYIVSTGTATASDVLKLIEHVRKTVAKKTGVELELEIKVIGV